MRDLHVDEAEVFCQVCGGAHVAILCVPAGMYIKPFFIRPAPGSGKLCLILLGVWLIKQTSKMIQSCHLWCLWVLFCFMSDFIIFSCFFVLHLVLLWCLLCPNLGGLRELSALVCGWRLCDLPQSRCQGRDAHHPGLGGAVGVGGRCLSVFGHGRFCWGKGQKRWWWLV